MLPWAHPLAVDPHTFALLALFGCSQFGLGLARLTLGTRLISATHAALLSALERPFAIAWVWIGLGEAPSRTAVIGGTIVMAAVIGDLAMRDRVVVPAASCLILHRLAAVTRHSASLVC